MHDSDSDQNADDRMQLAEELLAQRLARPEDADDPLGGLKGGIEPDSGRTTLVGAVMAFIVGLLIVWQAEPIARAIQGFTAGGGAADSPVIVYTIIGWVLVGAAVVLVVLSRFSSGIDFEVREQGLRYSDGKRTLDLRWKEINDIAIKQTEHVHVKYGKQSVEREITIQTDDETIIIPGLDELAFPMTDILSQQWEKAGAGHHSEKVDRSRRRSAEGSRRKTSRKADLTRIVAQKLDAGVSGKKLMAWLEEKHGLPRDAAEDVLANAMEHVQE